MVPTLTWGLSRSNLAFATLVSLLLVPVVSSDRLRGRGPWTANFANIVDFRPRVMLGGLQLADHPLRDVRGHFLVPLELHRVCRPALRVGAQVGRIAEHLRQRYVCAHDLRVAALLHPLKMSAPAVQVPEHIA